MIKLLQILAFFVCFQNQKNSAQSSFFLGFEEQLSTKHPLYILANKIDWAVFENAFKKHYSSNMGKPSKPIRLMVALLILKYVRNLSDESVVEQWAENSYYQYLSGEPSFVPGIPCVPTELVAFRHRIGEEGMELILKESIRINEPPGTTAGATLSLDTTVQERRSPHEYKLKRQRRMRIKEYHLSYR